MDYRPILHMLSPLRHVSPFDVNMAVDAGYQTVVPYTGVELAEVAGLVQDAIFSRGPKGARATGAFIGGRSAELAGRLCRLMLMVALPALAEADLDRFAMAVAQLQQATGDHFAPLQGGRFASPLVTEVLAWLESQGLRGVGQSSWGPTGFAIVGSATEAAALLTRATARWPEASGLAFAVTGGRNRGGEIDPPPKP